MCIRDRPYSDYIGKSLGELSFRQNFGVNVVAITRGDLNIYIPKSSEPIYPVSYTHLRLRFILHIQTHFYTGE